MNEISFRNQCRQPVYLSVCLSSVSPQPVCQPVSLVLSQQSNSIAHYQMEKKNKGIKLLFYAIPDSWWIFWSLLLQISMNAVSLSGSVTSMRTVKTLAALTFARVKMDSLEMERHAQLLQVGSIVRSNRSFSQGQRSLLTQLLSRLQKSAHKTNM